MRPLGPRRGIAAGACRASNDRTINPELERLMVKRMKAETIPPSTRIRRKSRA
jgi:hypothetical protein